MVAKLKNIWLKFVFSLSFAAINDIATNNSLNFFPIIIAITIQLVNIKFSERDSFLKVEHRIESTHKIAMLESIFKRFHSSIPICELNRAVLNALQVIRTLVLIISCVKNGGDRENLTDNILFPRNDLAASIHQRPADVVYKRFRNGDSFLLILIMCNFIYKRQSSGFSVHDHIHKLLTHNDYLSSLT